LTRYTGADATGGRHREAYDEGLLQDTGCSSHGSEGPDKEGLPSAGQAVSPGSQPRRQGSREQVQGHQRGLRGARGCEEARSVRRHPALPGHGVRVHRTHGQAGATAHERCRWHGFRFGRAETNVHRTPCDAAQGRHFVRTTIRHPRRRGIRQGRCIGGDSGGIGHHRVFGCPRPHLRPTTRGEDRAEAEALGPWRGHPLHHHGGLGSGGCRRDDPCRRAERRVLPRVQGLGCQGRNQGPDVQRLSGAGRDSPVPRHLRHQFLRIFASDIRCTANEPCRYPDPQPKLGTHAPFCHPHL